MQKIVVKTPQNVLISLKSAGVGRRFLAFVIDIIVICTYLFVVLFLASRIFNYSYNWFNNSDQVDFLSVMVNLLLLPVFFYSLLLETLLGGQTLGKIALGIKVLKLDGYKASFNEFFIRWLFRMVDIWVMLFAQIFLMAIFSNTDNVYVYSLLFFWFTGLVAVISISATKNAQRIGDLVAGTTVVLIKQKESINNTILKELTSDYQPKYPQVIKLSDNDARIIQQTYQNAIKSKDYQTIIKLKQKLEEVLGVKAQEKDILFIDLVMKDFNYYTQKM